MRTLGLALLMLSGLSGCLTSRPSDNALADALDAPLRACAEALAGEDIRSAREQCLPVVAIYEAGTVK